MTNPFARPRGKVHDLPVPLIHVGQQIPPFRIDSWSRKQLVRHMIREHSRVLRRLRLIGFGARADDGKFMLPHIKQSMRECLSVVDTAEEIEIAGVQASGHHHHDVVVNGCYVGGGSGWSGIDYHGQLLWRAKRNGNHVVFLQPLNLRLFGQRYLLNLINERR